MPRPSRRLALGAALLALAAATASPTWAAGAKSGGPPRPVCTDPRAGDPAAVRTETLTVDGEPAQALVALPRRAPRGIVVFDHGYGHTMESWRAHAARTADALGVIAIAPEYRGQRRVGVREDGLPVSRGWRVAEGAADTIAFAQAYEGRCAPSGPNVVYGVSMGGNTSGLVVAARPQAPDGSPLFNFWVDVEGASNVTETYLGATVLAPANAFAADAVADIEEAFGGTPAEMPATYAERTVVARTADIAAAGLQGVVVVHGAADGLVTYDHSRQLQALLRAQGVPVDVWTAVTRAEGTEPGTTLDGYAIGEASPFAGHASETSTTHVVGVAGFAALDRLYSGVPFTCGETVYDGSLDSAVQTPASSC